MSIFVLNFWATDCKTVRPMLSDRCLSVCLSYLYVCNVGVLWPNGWMDQDATWYTEVGPGDIVLDMRTQLSPTERGTAAPTFQPTLLWHGRPSQQLLSSCTLYSVSVIPTSFGGYVSGCLLSISKQVNLKTYGRVSMKVCILHFESF